MESLSNSGVNDLFVLLLQPQPGQSNVLLLFIEELDPFWELDQEQRYDKPCYDGCNPFIVLVIHRVRLQNHGVVVGKLG